MNILNVFVGVLTIFVCFRILGLFGVFEKSVGIGKVADVVKEHQKSSKKRESERVKLAMFAYFPKALSGMLMTDLAREKHKYVIERLEIKSEVLNRLLTPEELRGKYFSFAVIGLLAVPFAFFHPAVLIITAFTFVIFGGYMFIYKKKIEDEDEIIDVYFIDIYLLMYSKLRAGSKARIQTVIESYIDTLQVASNLEMKEVMLKFSKFFLNNLAMYEDHKAVPILRERYKSSTIINFCNVAVQALQGIDNADTLLTFKQDLIRRKTDVMRKKAQILLKKGEMAIYLIYIILFIFIGVGWYSKIPTGYF